MRGRLSEVGQGAGQARFQKVESRLADRQDGQILKLRTLDMTN